MKSFIKGFNQAIEMLTGIDFNMMLEGIGFLSITVFAPLVVILILIVIFEDKA